MKICFSQEECLSVLDMGFNNIFGKVLAPITDFCINNGEYEVTCEWAEPIDDDDL